MEYRGKRFTIVQGIGPDSWKWAGLFGRKNRQVWRGKDTGLGTDARDLGD